MEEPDAAAGGRRREQTRLIVLWGAALAFATKLATILLSLVLARLIASDLYGQYGVVSTILLFMMSFSMQRFTENIFHKTPTADDYHRHLAFGLVLHGFLFVSANIIAAGMVLNKGLSNIAIYIHAGSFAFILNVPRMIYVTHLRLSLKWKKIRSLTLMSFGLYAVASLFLAWKGYGVWALLAQNLLVPVPYIVAFLLDDSLPKGLNFNFREFRAAFRFGAARSGGAAVGTAYGAIESLIFSLTLDFGMLGVFNRARGLSQLATSWLSDQLGSILYPSLAALTSRSDTARRTAGLLFRVNLWTSGTVAVAVAAAPHAAVDVLYGDHWQAAVPLIQPILLAALAGSMLTTCSLVLLTNMGPRHAITLDVTVVVFNALGLFVVGPGGTLAYSIYLGLANLGLIMAALIYMTRINLLAVGDLLRALSPLVVTAILALTAATAPAFARAEQTWPLATLLAISAACSVLMAILARTFDARGLATILGLLPGGTLMRRLLALPPPVRL